MLHFRLGHPNFQYMEHLFPHLFSKIDVSILACDICIWAKQHEVSFPSQPYKPIHPFALVHGNVWGPTAFGKQWFVIFIDILVLLGSVSSLKNLWSLMSFKNSIRP